MKSLEGLSVRTSNCLLRMGLTRRKDILQAVRNRTLHPSNVNALGFGAESLREVRSWLGLKPELTNQEVHQMRGWFCRRLRTINGLSYRDIARILRLRGPDEARRLEAAHTRKFKEL